MQVLHRLIHDLNLGFHAVRREETGDFLTVLLFGEAGVERREWVVFDRIYRIVRIRILRGEKCVVFSGRRRGDTPPYQCFAQSTIASPFPVPRSWFPIQQIHERTERHKLAER